MQGVKRAIACSVAAMSVMSGAEAQCIQRCTSGRWDIGNGYTAECWFGSTGSDRYGCLTTCGTTSFSIEWDYPAYGFLHEVGRYNLNTMIDNCNPGAKAFHVHAFERSSGIGGFCGLYGWFFQPGATWPQGSIEWYIVEDWSFSGTMRPGTNKGTVTVDGGTYTIYQSRGGNPSEGYWDQWWSIRNAKRTSGVISYPDHFRAWRNAGMANKQIGRIAFMMETSWGGPTAGKITFSQYSIDRPTESSTATQEPLVVHSRKALSSGSMPLLFDIRGCVVQNSPTIVVSGYLIRVGDGAITSHPFLQGTSCFR